MKVNMPVQTLCMLTLQEYIKTEAPTSTDDLTVYPFKYDWSKVVLILNSSLYYERKL